MVIIALEVSPNIIPFLALFPSPLVIFNGEVFRKDFAQLPVGVLHILLNRSGESRGEHETEAEDGCSCFLKPASRKALISAALLIFAAHFAQTREEPSPSSTTYDKSRRSKASGCFTNTPLLPEAENRFSVDTRFSQKFP
jgi:hypothetical protein